MHWKISSQRQITHSINQTTLLVKNKKKRNIDAMMF